MPQASAMAAKAAADAFKEWAGEMLLYIRTNR